MRLSVEIREKDDATSSGPVQVCIAVSGRRRAAQRKRAFPELLSFAGCRVGGPDGPCLRVLFENWFGSTAVARSSHKCDLLSVRRPARARIARCRRGEVDDGCRVVCVDADERMVAAV